MAVTNRQVGHLNRSIALRLQGGLSLYKSADQAANPEDRDRYAPELFQSLPDFSLPDYLLQLKIGMPVMLLRNLDAPRLCNGTRIRLTAVGQRMLKGEIMGGSYAGEPVLIPRIPLQSKDDNPHIPCPFIRLQFPIRPAFVLQWSKKIRW